MPGYWAGQKRRADRNTTVILRGSYAKLFRQWTTLCTEDGQASSQRPPVLGQAQIGKGNAGNGRRTAEAPEAGWQGMQVQGGVKPTELRVCDQCGQ